MHAEGWSLWRGRIQNETAEPAVTAPSYGRHGQSRSHPLPPELGVDAQTFQLRDIAAPVPLLCERRVRWYLDNRAYARHVYDTDDPARVDIRRNDRHPSRCGAFFCVLSGASALGRPSYIPRFPCLSRSLMHRIDFGLVSGPVRPDAFPKCVGRGAIARTEGTYFQVYCRPRLLAYPAPGP